MFLSGYVFAFVIGVAVGFLFAANMILNGLDQSTWADGHKPLHLLAHRPYGLKGAAWFDRFTIASILAIFLLRRSVLSNSYWRNYVYSLRYQPLRTLRKSAEANVVPGKSFPLSTLKMFSNVFGKLTTDCQQTSRNRVVVSTSLVVMCSRCPSVGFLKPCQG